MSSGNGYKIGCDDCLWGEDFFGDDKFLGHIWAAVQTELLTRRRLREGDLWVSEFFDMDTLLENLELDEELSIGLVKGGLWKTTAPVAPSQKSYGWKWSLESKLLLAVLAFWGQACILTLVLKPKVIYYQYNDFSDGTSIALSSNARLLPYDLSLPPSGIGSPLHIGPGPDL